MEHAVVSFAADEDLFRRAEDQTILPKGRSKAMHELMDKAGANHDRDLWIGIGHLLIRSYDRGDLTPQVSDHFVDSCPEKVFRLFANECPRRRFRNWHYRANRLGIGKH